MRAWPLALALVLACTPLPKRGPSAPEPIESEVFDLVVHVPVGWHLVGVDRADERLFVHLEQGDLVLWVGAHMADTQEDALALLQNRGNVRATVQTNWLGVGAALADADDPFSTEGRRVETRLVATSGLCQYEMTIAAPEARAQEAHELLLALRNIASGRGILYPKAAACTPVAAAPDGGMPVSVKP